ncbi:hypothetical protein TCA2_4834 [Paenibacillus sp. TCA20]|nr:hypothetical protein TCA2_4834 [Paenibacillus sp. TCA20]
MFFFIWFFLIGILSLVMGIRALRNPDAWPFDRYVDEDGETDLVNIKIRGICLLAFGAVLTILSFQQLI